MLSLVQFEGLYSGRLSYVDTDSLEARQAFGVVSLHMKGELFAAHRVQLLSLVKRMKDDGKRGALILCFPESVQFSRVDLDLFKDMFTFSIEGGSQLTIVCSLAEKETLLDYSRTKRIPCFDSYLQAMLSIDESFLRSFPEKVTRNIILLENDFQLRGVLFMTLMRVRFSTVETQSFEEMDQYLEKFGDYTDGAIIQIVYPRYNEIQLLEKLKSKRPDAQVIINSDVLDENVLNMCKQFKVASAMKRPYKSEELMRRLFKQFPERRNNYMGT